MCGISGVLDGTLPPEDRLAAATDRMASTLSHRGPDDAGTWVSAPDGLGFGFRRLAILDLSDCGHQPMVSPSGRYVLQFNGEIYDYVALRSRLGLTAADFRGGSDTEVLLAAIDRWGLKRALERCEGMFALALWDRHERRLSLARDRFGEKPLYCGRFGRTFLFASELKALRAHPQFRCDLDTSALTAYLRHGYVPGDRCMIDGVSKVPPGTLLTVSAEGTTSVPEPFWRLSDLVASARARPLHVSDDEAADLVEAELRRAVAERMHSDVALGAFLSGGVDSSLVVAMMQLDAARPVRSFTIGFDEAGYDEASAAAAVADHLGTDHTEFRVSAADALDVVPQLPRMYDEPFADSSQIPTHLVSRLAARDVTVALSGDGGDELFGGYTRYEALSRVWKTLQPLPAPLRRGLARSVSSVAPETWDRLLSRAAGVVPVAGRYSHAGDKVHKLAAVAGSRDFAAAFLAVASTCGSPQEYVVGPARSGDAHTPHAHALPQLGDVERMMYVDSMTYLPDDILVKVDRASMAVSLETRVPFLDTRLAELAWRLPLSQKIRGDTGKWLLRRVLARHVPPVLTDRPKQGFAVPLGAWLRGPLRPWAEDLLDPARVAGDGHLRPEAVQAAWRTHVSGRRDLSPQLWSILMFQAWWQDQAVTG